MPHSLHAHIARFPDSPRGGERVGGQRITRASESARGRIDWLNSDPRRSSAAFDVAARVTRFMTRTTPTLTPAIRAGRGSSVGPSASGPGAGKAAAVKASCSMRGRRTVAVLAARLVVPRGSHEEHERARLNEQIDVEHGTLVRLRTHNETSGGRGGVVVVVVVVCGWWARLGARKQREGAEERGRHERGAARPGGVEGGARQAERHARIAEHEEQLQEGGGGGEAGERVVEACHLTRATERGEGRGWSRARLGSRPPAP